MYYPPTGFPAYLFPANMYPGSLKRGGKKRQKAKVTPQLGPPRAKIRFWRNNGKRHNSNHNSNNSTEAVEASVAHL